MIETNKVNKAFTLFTMVWQGILGNKWHVFTRMCTIQFPALRKCSGETYACGCGSDGIYFLSFTILVIVIRSAVVNV